MKETGTERAISKGIMKASSADLGLHVHELADSMGVRVEPHLHPHYLWNAYARVVFSFDDKMLSMHINIAPVRGVFTYAIAMHELGHLRIDGPVQSRQAVYRLWSDRSFEMAEERAAWEWAKAHALLWLPPMAAVEKYALYSHEHNLSLPEVVSRLRVSKEVTL